MTQHTHQVRIYYEDTDVSGMVYHANYLKYFERAREHFIGPEELVRLFEEEDTAFVVYKAELTYKEGARLGDELEIRSRVEAESKYRAIFHQNVHRKGHEATMVEGRVELVCVNHQQNLVPLPKSVVDSIAKLQASA